MNLNGFLKIMRRVMQTVLTALIIFLISSNCLLGQDKNKKESSDKQPALTVYNVKDFGATGDGKTIDSPSINKAIEDGIKRGLF